MGTGNLVIYKKGAARAGSSFRSGREADYSSSAFLAAGFLA